MNEKRVFIVGVQKCGTTTIANAMSRLEGFELSLPKEPMVFSKGDVANHRALSLLANLDWREKSNLDLMSEYQRCFTEDLPCKIDASTSYFCSDLAIERIRTIFEGAKILILIRDPVSRFASAYWHYVRSGLMIHTPNKALSFGPYNLLAFGCYKERIERWKAAFGANVHVACLEAIQQSPENYAEEIRYFLDVSLSQRQKDIFVDGLRKRENSGQVPRLRRTQLILNYLRQATYEDFTRNAPSSGLLKKYGFVGLSLHALSRLNFGNGKTPPLPDNVREQLIVFYSKSNANLDQVIDFGTSAAWSRLESAV